MFVTSPLEANKLKKIGITKFKEHCLALIDHLAPEGLVITKHGKPVARVIPFPQPADSLIGALKGRIAIHGDILSTGVSWDADDQS